MNLDEFPKCPRTLSRAEERKLRKASLHKPHIERLTRYVDRLKEFKGNEGLEFPYFDPLDGGAEANILFLFEKPGPMTSEAGGGSGFISRDNDDDTAEATFNFMNIAGIDRKRTLIWNVMPGWDGDIRTTALELDKGLGYLKELFDLLPKVNTVVFVGKKAKKAGPTVKIIRSKIHCLESRHPSALGMAGSPEMWFQIPYIWWQANQVSQNKPAPPFF